MVVVEAPSTGASVAGDVTTLIRTLGAHDIAAVVLRDGRFCLANDPAREAVSDVDVDEAPAELDARLADGLAVDGRLGGLVPGEQRSVQIELATNRALLQREAVAELVDLDGPAVLVTFPVHAIQETDPEHLARLETMLESTSDIIAVLDGDGRVRYSNGAGRRLTGLTGRDVNGRSIADLVHPADLDAAVDYLAGAVHGEAADPLEFQLRFADGTYHPVEGEVTAHVEVDGAPGYVVTLRDVSERVRRQAEEESAQRRLEALVENLDDVIVVLGPELEVTWASPGIERLVDAPAYTNVGEHAFNDMHPDDIGGVLEAIEEVTAKPDARSRAEFRIHHRRRGWRWVEASVVNRLDDADIGGLVCTLRDVTETRDLDAELRRLHEADRQEVARLREADRLKDLFLATISHELRTPLSSVRGFSDVLAQQGDDLDDATRADMVVRIRTNALEMERMIDQLLELSRLQAGRVNLQIERLPVDGVVGGLIDQLEHQLRDHEVVSDLVGLAVRADRRALEHVLRNLLTNAARYSEPGSRIEIDGDEEDGSVHIRVRDHGVGIAPEDQNRIFQSFFQVDTGTTGRRGTGVGLNIARRYAQLLSGRLSVVSEPGVGSTFTVTLPAATGPR